MYRMVVTDLDGTLLNNKKQVSEANAKAIQNLKDQNITFVMATGRSDVMTRAYTKQLKNIDIVIGCDGAVIRNIRTGEILYENHLRSETCHTTFEICKKYGLQYYVFAKDELVSDDPQNERFLIHQKFNQTVEEDEEIPMQIVDDLNEYVENFDPNKFLISAPADYLKTQFEDFRLPFGDMLTICTSAPFYIEVVDNGIDKGSALRDLSEQMHVSKDEIIAFGDEMNDLTMLQFAGCGVAMGNAVKPIRLIADKITASNDDDGIAVTLEKYL